MATNNVTNNYSPLTTKGDLFTFDTANNRLPVGSNYYFVQADSTAGVGLSYQLPIKADEVVSYQLIDFYASTNGDNQCNTQANGTGASSAIIDVLDNTRAGLIKLDMGTTTTGNALVAQTSTSRKNIILGASTVILETCINLNTLSNGTDTYTFMFGALDTQLSTTPTNGVWIGYSSGVNSGNWTINSRAGAGTSTTNAASGPSAATWYKLRLVITNASSAQAFVGVAGSDFTSIGTLSASLPTAALTIWTVQLIKSAGTTDTFGYVDYVSSKVIYNSLR